nr:hypothetical protein [Bacteroidota bacterium]
VKAQRKTLFGFEGAFCQDLYKIHDLNNNMENVQLGTGLGGIRIRHEIRNNTIAETGILFKPYLQGFTFSNNPIYGITNAFNAVLIPLRFGYKIKMIGKYFLVPAAGFTFGINVSPGLASGTGRGKFVSGGTTAEYYYDENNNITRGFIMAQPSIAIERTVFGNILASISASRAFGFNKVHHLDVTYTINNSASMNGKAVSRGDYWSWGLALMYPISNLWQKD